MIYVSTGSLTRGDLALVAASPKLLRGAGLELGSALPADLARDVLAMVEQGGCKALVHHYFPPPDDPFVINLASSDPDVLERSLEHCRGSLRLCARLGSSYSVHAGLALDPDPADLGRPLADHPVIPMERAMDIFMRSVEALAAEARSLGVGLAVENNVVAGFNAPDGVNRVCLVASADQIGEFLERAPESVGLLLDLGHLKVSAAVLGFDAPATCEMAAPRVTALHLHDNCARVDRHLPFDENVWFAPLLGRFAAADMVVETTPRSLATVLDMTAMLEIMIGKDTGGGR